MTTSSNEAGYVLSKLLNAVDHLASSPDTLQARLANAWISHLHILGRRDDFLVPDLRNTWDSLHDRITAKGNPDETFASMSDADATEVAQRIVTLSRKYAKFVEDEASAASC